jgi:hypothetical protein
MRHVYQFDLDTNLRKFEFEYHTDNQVHHQLNYL